MLTELFADLERHGWQWSVALDEHGDWWLEAFKDSRSFSVSSRTFDGQQQMVRCVLRWPELLDRHKGLCECQYAGRLWQYVMHLNDEHKWTREEIAGWLEREPWLKDTVG